MAGYLEIADGQVGYKAPSENVTKYWADLYPAFQGQPWCGAFTSWCLWKAGALAATGGAMYYCPSMVSRAKSRGQWASTPVVGALALYDWGAGIAAHVEFVAGVPSPGTINVIGGNTGDDQVIRRNRTTSQVMGYWHIEAPTGSISAGTGAAGPSRPSYGTLTAAAAQTIEGEGDEESRVRFARRAGFLNG